MALVIVIFSSDSGKEIATEFVPSWEKFAHYCFTFKFMISAFLWMLLFSHLLLTHKPFNQFFAGQWWLFRNKSV